MRIRDRTAGAKVVPSLVLFSVRQVVSCFQGLRRLLRKNSVVAAMTMFSPCQRNQMSAIAALCMSFLVSTVCGQSNPLGATSPQPESDNTVLIIIIICALVGLVIIVAIVIVARRKCGGPKQRHAIHNDNFQPFDMGM